MSRLLRVLKVVVEGRRLKLGRLYFSDELIMFVYDPIGSQSPRPVRFCDILCGGEGNSCVVYLNLLIEYGSLQFRHCCLNSAAFTN